MSGTSDPEQIQRDSEPQDDQQTTVDRRTKGITEPDSAAHTARHQDHNFNSTGGTVGRSVTEGKEQTVQRQEISDTVRKQRVGVEEDYDRLHRTAQQSSERQYPAMRRAMDRLQGLLNRFAPDELETLAARIEDAVKSPAITGPQATLVAALSGRREYSQQERIALEFSALLRSFQWRRELLAGSFTAPQVAELLGTSRQTPHDRAKGGSLLAVLDRGALRFPAWQFDPEGPDGVVPGLPTVLRALRVPPLLKVSWLARPNPYLEGRTPADALRRGEVERVAALAQAVGVS